MVFLRGVCNHSWEFLSSLIPAQVFVPCGLGRVTFYTELKRQKMKVVRIVKEAVEHYGPDHQLRKLQEECGELIAAIQHYKDGRDNALAELIGEIADVFFLLMQARIFMGQSIIDNAIDLKANRQHERILDEKYPDAV